MSHLIGNEIVAKSQWLELYLNKLTVCRTVIEITYKIKSFRCPVTLIISSEFPVHNINLYINLSCNVLSL